jgi:hypothetical protein
MTEAKSGTGGHPQAASAGLLEPGETPAPVACLSHSKRAALITCVKGDGTLRKCGGIWSAPSTAGDHRPIFGVTVADLCREGMMTITVAGKNPVAKLTPQGMWYGRTALTEMAIVSRGPERWTVRRHA